MKLVIDIDEKKYEEIKRIAKAQFELTDKTEAQIIADGIPYEPKGDLISREAIKKIVVGMLEKWADSYCYIEIPTDDAIKEMKFAIDNAPTALHNNYSMGYQDGVRKVLSERHLGTWVDGYGGEYRCTNCSAHSAQMTPYCWCCGADMKGKRK